ncbi:MAG: hypothetical protein IIB27_02050 [Chloroflexi bacterium]|nr:hypothetical protein [Chloroflexota bacterium]MCH7642636.1 hypothetical protein [Chloroflexota bacterium]
MSTCEYLKSAGYSVVALDIHVANRRSRPFCDAGGWEVAATVNSHHGESMTIGRIRLA